MKIRFWVNVSLVLLAGTGVIGCVSQEKTFYGTISIANEPDTALSSVEVKGFDDDPPVGTLAPRASKTALMMKRLPVPKRLTITWKENDNAFRTVLSIGSDSIPEDSRNRELVVVYQGDGRWAVRFEGAVVTY